MKKATLFLSALLLLSNLGFSQWSPAGLSLTDNIFRTGAVGIGFTAFPTFGTNKLMIDGDSYFSGNIGLGTTSPASKFHMPSGQFKME